MWIMRTRGYSKEDILKMHKEGTLASILSNVSVQMYKGSPIIRVKDVKEIENKSKSNCEKDNKSTNKVQNNKIESENVKKSNGCMKLKELDKTAAKVLWEAVQRKFKEIEQEMGVTVTLDVAKYCTEGDPEFYGKYHIRIGSKDEAMQRKWNEDIQGYYGIKWGLTPQDYGKEIEVNGEKVRVVELKPKATKYCLGVIKKDGSKIYYTEHTLRLLHPEKAQNK